MFNDRYGLTQAVLEGRKTMTRRLFTANINDMNVINKSLNDEKENLNENHMAIINKYAHYKIGEIIAIAQPYKDIAEDRYFINQCLANEQRPESMKYEKGWNNKMFVAAYYMPHRIRITEIKVEKLQDISEEDCLKEGIQEVFPYIDRNPDDKVKTFQYFDHAKKRLHKWSPANECFGRVIDAINGKGTWDKNPWVFAYTFKLED